MPKMVNNWLVKDDDKLFDIIYDIKERLREDLYHVIRDDFKKYISRRIEEGDLTSDWRDEQIGLTMEVKVDDAIREYKNDLAHRMSVYGENTSDFYLSIDVYKVKYGYILIPLGPHRHFLKGNIIGKYSLPGGEDGVRYFGSFEDEKLYEDNVTEEEKSKREETAEEILNMCRLAMQSKTHEPFISVVVFGMKDLKWNQVSLLSSAIIDVCEELEIDTGGLHVRNY